MIQLSRVMVNNSEFTCYDCYGIVQITVEPRYLEVPREMKKKFEIAGFRNNREPLVTRKKKSLVPRV